VLRGEMAQGEAEAFVDTYSRRLAQYTYLD